MLKDGFLRFCDDPEIACCRGEAELGQLRQENIRLRAELLESQRRADAAVEDLENLIDRECACSYCSHLLETGACALDIKYGDGTCSAQWRGPQDEKGEAE